MCEACARSIEAWAKRDQREVRTYKGVHLVKKALSDGSTAAYFYGWRGGAVFAGHGTGVEFPSRKFDVQLETAKSKKPKTLTAAPLKVSDFIVGYKVENGPKSQRKRNYASLQPATQASYDLHLTRIHDKWGNLPAHLITEKTVPQLRSRIMAWLTDEIAPKHGVPSADYTLKVMSLVFNHAIFHGRLSKNAHPTIDIPLTYSGGHRPDKLWEEEREIAFYKAAPAYLARGLFLACWTGQRQEDCVRMRFGEGEKGQPYYDPETKWVFLYQGKTKALVGFPAPDLLRQNLDAEWARREREAIRETRILLTTEGKPWAHVHSFSAKFNNTKNALQNGAFADLHYHDARGTAATRLALASVPLVEIAAITGHKETAIRTLVERYLGGRVDLAKKAMDKAHQDHEYVERMRRIGEAFQWAA